MRHSAGAAIVLGGFVAGTIDIGSACAINELSPEVILHAIASGLLGKASFTGGWPTAALGLVLQWAMSMIIAAIYVMAARLLPLLSRAWPLWGILYGVPVYFVMTYVVVPLSNAPFRHDAQPIDKIVENLLAMMLFGLIVAFFARSDSGNST